LDQTSGWSGADAGIVAQAAKILWVEPMRAPQPVRKMQKAGADPA